MMEAEPALTQALAEALSNRRARVMSGEDRRQSVYCLLDSIACGLAAAEAPIMGRLLRGSAAGDQAVLGHGHVGDRDTAILANVAAIRHLDFNDVYSNRNNLHPSEIVVPLALSFAQGLGWAGRDLIEAIGRGYSTNLWIGEAWEGLLDRGWAPTATTGTLAAAAITCDVLDLDQDRVANALALAAITAPTLGVVFRGRISDAKSLINGLAVLTGLRAAELAARGVTGPANAFEGPSGFNQMIGPPLSTRDQPANELLGPGSIWRKRYPIVFHAHAAVESATKASLKLGAGDRIDRVLVRVSDKVAAVAAGPDRWSPQTPEDAQFSLPFCVAIAVTTGDLTLAHLTDDWLSDTRVRQLMSRIEVQAAPEWQTYTRASVVIVAGGDLYEESVGIPTGHADAPMTETQITDKARALISCWNPERADTVIETILQIDGPTPVQHLIEATSQQETR